MVDSERRRTILRAGVGIGAGVTVLGGGGVLIYDYAKERERNDNTLQTTSRTAETEQAIADYDWDRYQLSAPAIDPERATVAIDPHGTTGEGGTRYAATVAVPVDDPSIDVCRHAGDPTDEWLLGQKLYEDAVRVFDASMETLGPAHPTHRSAEEDRIDRVTYRFVDSDGSMEVPFTAEDMYYAGGDASPENLHPEEEYTRERFREIYRQNIRVACPA